MHTKWSVFAEQQLLWTMSDKQIWLNEAASHSSLSLQIRNTWWTQERVHAHTHTHTHSVVRTHWEHTSQRERRFSGRSCLSCVPTQLSEYEPEETATSHLIFTLVFFLCFIYLYISCLFFFSSSYSYFTVTSGVCWPTQAPSPLSSQLLWNWWSHRLGHAYIGTCTRTTHDTIPTTGKALSQSRQENSGKPGYNLALMEPKRFPPGRWAPSYWEKPKDRQRKLHPGKCLCSTLSSLAFCPANEWLFVYS